MVVEKILKQLTPERAERELKSIQDVKLPPELQKWVKEYEKVGKRDGFIWKWTYIGMERLTLPIIEKEYYRSVIVAKFLSIILNVLYDDIADQKKDKKMMEISFGIYSNPDKFKNNFKLSNLSAKDKNYLKLIQKIWKSLNSLIKNYPNYEKFKDLLEYDYLQYLNTIRYSYLVNKNHCLINSIEYNIYLHHNMHGMISMTIDLMCSPKFNIEELGSFRKMSWMIQQMGRIGNLIMTWNKEIYADDFTSDIFAYALENNIINLKDLLKNKEQVIRKIKSSRAENHFLSQWENYYKEINNLNKKLKCINVKNILNGAEEFLIMHLVSKNLEI